MKNIFRLLIIFFLLVKISYAQTCDTTCCPVTCVGNCTYQVCVNDSNSTTIERLPYLLPTSIPSGTCNHEYVIEGKVDKVPFVLKHTWKECVTKPCAFSSVPVITSITSTCNSITVVWNPIAGAANYKVALNSGAPIVTTNTTYTFTGLNLETNYNVSVQACDSLGSCGAIAIKTEKTSAFNLPQDPFWSHGRLTDGYIEARVFANNLDCAPTHYFIFLFKKLTDASWDVVEKKIMRSFDPNKPITSATFIKHFIGGENYAVWDAVKVISCNKEDKCSVGIVKSVKGKTPGSMF